MNQYKKIKLKNGLIKLIPNDIKMESISLCLTCSNSKSCHKNQDRVKNCKSYQEVTNEQEDCM